jgi:hypothetical protein
LQTSHSSSSWGRTASSVDSIMLVDIVPMR